MSLRKWAAAFISAPEARGQNSVSANKPAAPVRATRALLVRPIECKIRLDRQCINRATLASLGENCTSIFVAWRRTTSRFLSHRRAKHQASKPKLQRSSNLKTSNPKNRCRGKRRAGRVLSLVLGASLELGVWNLELFSRLLSHHSSPSVRNGALCATNLSIESNDGMKSFRDLFLCLSATAITITRVQAARITFQSEERQTSLIELYTSEGCSSCPPAEAWLSRLKENKQLWRDFVPVAFHVDYWDRLGWRDRFASKEWTMRQQVFADRWKAGSVYTPGFVLDGSESSPAVPSNSQENVGTLRLKSDGDEVRLSFEPAKADASGYEVYLVTLGFGLATNVKAGENSGR